VPHVVLLPPARIVRQHPLSTKRATVCRYIVRSSFIQGREVTHYRAARVSGACGCNHASMNYGYLARRCA
jgi:hypothetical protein